MCDHSRKKLSPSEASGARSNFVKAVQGRRDAEETQPWRCTGCGTAVRRGYNDLCPCLGVGDRPVGNPGFPFVHSKTHVRKALL